MIRVGRGVAASILLVACLSTASGPAGAAGVCTPDPTPRDDEISCSEEADSVTGLAGDDVLFGGSGTDLLGGDGGNDQVYGEGGDDTLSGDSGSDYLE